MTFPDLTNQLIGVLIRFREERVTIMADIEARLRLQKNIEVPCNSCGGKTVTSINVQWIMGCVFMLLVVFLHLTAVTMLS